MKLAIVPITEIHFGERFRKDLGDIDELANSILAKGIINPITVQARADLPGSARFLLIAGGRRFTAAGVAGLERVPVRIYDRPLSEYELRAIELEENIKRKDLHWMEQVELQRELDELYKSIKGEKVSTSPDAAGHSLRDTAKLLGRSIGSVSMDVKLARMVQELPELEWSKCRNKHEAMKLANRVEESIVKSEMARRAQAILSPSSANGQKSDVAKAGVRRKLINSYIVGDFFEKSSTLEPESFNLIEIDPPYGISLGDIKQVQSDTSIWDYSSDGYNEISADTYQVFLANLFERCYKLAAKNSWLLCWFAPEPWAEIVYQELSNAGFSLSRRCGIWVKPNAQCNQPNTSLASAYESFYWASKGSPTLGKPGSFNVFQETATSPIKKIHPTERPLPLMTRLLETFAFPGSHVLVPFAGSGVTLMAAHQLNMFPIGFDLSQKFKDNYIVRVMEAEL